MAYSEDSEWRNRTEFVQGRDQIRAFLRRKVLWRYPVKSMAGERIAQIEVGSLGLAGDRTVLVRNQGKVVTSRTHHPLLGLKGRLDEDGVPRISGHAWNAPEALALVKAAAGPNADLLAGLLDFIFTC